MCQHAGRDVSCGTFRVADVQLAFSKAARRLEALARGRRVNDTSINYLEGLFDVNRALRREVSEHDADYFIIGRAGRYKVGGWGVAQAGWLAQQ